MRRLAHAAARHALRLSGALAFASHTLAAQEPADSTRRAATPLDAVVVSATRTSQTLRSLPADVVVLDAQTIASTPAHTVPDLLRTIPGFTTRDFQSGFVSGPSQSIVSFRGLGGSSAGRALVLLDGIPAGDPFSGWLDWGRIPLPMLQSAEVVRGGGSTIWGSRSLGGVVNLRTIDPRSDAAQLMLEGGSLGTYHGAGSASVRRGELSALLGGDFWNTDGFVLLPPDQRGPVDRREATTSRSVQGKAAWDASSALQLWAGGGSYAGGDRPLGIEDRQRFDEGRGGLRWLAPGGGIGTVAIFANRRTSLGKSFSVNSDRTAETPQRYNNAPAHSAGASLQWTQLALGRHELTAGADLSSAHGTFAEQFAFTNEQATREREVGGTQRIAGVFVQDAADVGAGVHLVGSVRADRVSNAGASRTLRDLEQGTVVSDTSFRDRATTQATYSLGLRWQQTGWLGWRASVYDAFRAPSMYELYYARFSSKGTVTEANAALDAERLRGVEAGIDLSPGGGFLARVTAFRNRVASPIMDVTIGTAGAQAEVIEPCGLMPAKQTCGQRRNVPGLLSRGVESELEWQPGSTWRFGAGYAFSPTRVIAPGQPVDGKSAIRSARHMISTSAGFDAPRWVSASLDARYVSERYDDDLNQVRLDGFYLVGLRLSRAIARGLSANVKVENLLNEEFQISRTRSGLADMGAPRWITAGIRAAW
jgi:outer membrane cobalamin receptor